MKIGELLANYMWPIIAGVIIVVVGGLILSLIQSKRRPIYKSETSNEEVPAGGREKPDFHHSFRQVELRLRKLRKRLGGGTVGRQERFNPDVILGVLSERLVGGCIIGAWLASPIFFDAKKFYPIYYYKKSNKAELLKEFKKDVKAQKWKDFLLVDDDSHSGRTIETVHKELMKFLPRDAKLKIVVVVIRKESWSDYYHKLWEKDAVYCYSDVALKHDVHWPWEV